MENLAIYKGVDLSGGETRGELDILSQHTP